MGRAKQHILSFIANRWDTGSLIRHSQSVLIFPFYHTVSDHYLPHIHPLYTPKTTSEFSKDLDFLLNHFQPVGMEDVMAHIEGTKIISKPSFHLSFDDGLRGVYEIALPILYQKGIPFTVFINSAFADNKDLFYRYKAALIVNQLNKKSPQPETLKILSCTYPERAKLDLIAGAFAINFQDFLQKQRPYLSLSELKQMHDKGVTIGAHSIDHPPFTQISDKEQIRQVVKSSAYIQKNIGEQRRYFAFPFTDTGISEAFFSDISAQVDLTFGTSGIYFRQKGRHIGRIDMEKYGKNARECVNKACLARILKHHI